MFDNYEKEVVAVTDMQTYSYPERGFQKNNTNALLGIIPAVDGIKTGYTGNAGYCLAFSMVVDKDEKNEIRHRMIGVVLGTNHKDKRLSASLSLLKYGKENFSTTKVMEKDQLIGKKYIKGLSDLEVVLKSKDELYATLKNTENLKSQITLKELKYPVKKGDTLGVIKYYTETGQVIGSVDIISDNNMDNISLVNKIKMIFTD
jgi:D-alanyl-D-alanine carboxypeptidase